MKRAQPEPSFILWQGDNFGHVPGGDTEELVLDSTQLLAGLLGDAFPGVPIVPTIGNHDTFPVRKSLELCNTLTSHAPLATFAAQTPVQ